MGIGSIRHSPSKSFQTIIVPGGSNPVADDPTDSITYTSSDNSITITGTDDPESLDFIVASAPTSPDNYSFLKVSAMTFAIIPVDQQMIVVGSFEIDASLEILGSLALI